MRRNLSWLLGLLIAVAVGAFLRPKPTPAPTSSPSPAASRTPAPGTPALSYFEQNEKRERYSFKVDGRPGAWTYQCLLSIGTTRLQDDGNLADEELTRIQSGLRTASQISDFPAVIDFYPKPSERSISPTAVAEFYFTEPKSQQTTGGICHPQPRSRIWKTLQAELRSTEIFRERDQLRREMHARFNR